MEKERIKNMHKHTHTHQTVACGFLLAGRQKHTGRSRSNLLTVDLCCCVTWKESHQASHYGIKQPAAMIPTQECVGKHLEERFRCYFEICASAQRPENTCCRKRASTFFWKFKTFFCVLPQSVFLLMKTHTRWQNNVSLTAETEGKYNKGR